MVTRLSCKGLLSRTVLAILQDHLDGSHMDLRIGSEPSRWQLPIDSIDQSMGNQDYRRPHIRTSDGQQNVKSLKDGLGVKDLGPENPGSTISLTTSASPSAEIRHDQARSANSSPLQRSTTSTDQGIRATESTSSSESKSGGTGRLL